MGLFESVVLGPIPRRLIHMERAVRLKHQSRASEPAVTQ